MLAKCKTLVSVLLAAWLLPTGMQVAGAGELAPVPVASAARPVPDWQAAALPSEMQAQLQKSGVDLNDVAVLVAPLEGGSALVAHNVQQSMNPASVMKLVSTAAALELLTPNYRWHTRIYTDGVQQGSTLVGNLYVQGGGDPLLVQERLALLMQQLRNQGIAQITGDVVVDRSAFTVPAADPAAFDGAALEPYNVQPDAFLLNFNSVALVFSPDAAQHQVAITTEPPLPSGMVPTSLPLGDGDCTSWLQQLQHGTEQTGQLQVPSQPYPQSCGNKTWRSAWPQPEQFTHVALQGMWQQLGGSWQGKVRNGSIPAALKAQKPLAELESSSLSEVVHGINKFSNNVMARQVFLSLSLAQQGQGSLPASRQILQQWWQRRIPNSTPPTVDNGAGLSRQARVSASALGHLLWHMWQSPVLPQWLDSLPVYGVDGTLRRVQSPAAGQAHLKTGTLNNANSLAGYVTDTQGRHYVLVALAQGEQAHRARQAMYTLVDWVAAH